MLGGIILILLGILPLYFAMGWWNTFFDSASWKEVPGTVISATIETRRSSKGNISYRLKAKYRYVYASETIVRDRLFIESGTSGSREWTEKNLRFLESNRKGGTPIPVLVNPKSPGEAILFRCISFTMGLFPLIGLICFAMGIGIISMGFQNLTVGLRRRSLQEKFPGQPWMIEENWNQFRVESSGFQKSLVLWLFGGAWAFFCGMFWAALISTRESEFLPIFTVAILSLIGLGLLSYALYLTMRFAKYGKSAIMLSQFPLNTGSEFLGALLIKTHLVATDGIDVVLKCEKTTVTGSGKHKNSQTDILLEIALNVKKDLARPQEHRSVIPFQFQVPANLPGRSMETNPSFRWKLETKASTPGIDFAEEFELPVYHVDDLSLIRKHPSFGQVNSSG